MIDTQFDRRNSKGDLDLYQGLTGCGAKRSRRFVNACGNLPNAEIGQSYDRWERVDDGRKNGPRRPDAKQEKGRNKVYVGRQRLHRIENRFNNCLEPITLRGANTECDANNGAKGDGDTHKTERLHGLVPHIQYKP